MVLIHPQTHTKTFLASGKIMLFGEYLVLKGANSLSFPLRYHQELQVAPASELSWQSFDPEGCWFKMKMNEQLQVTSANNEKVAAVLEKIFRHIRHVKPELSFQQDFVVKANFNLQWGFGSSSSLISLLSQWSGVDPYPMLDAYFGGSGYDIACATADQPIIYNMQDRLVKEVELPRSVTDHVLFIYLDKKQSSKDEIARFERAEVKAEHVQQMNQIIEDLQLAADIDSFEKQIVQSENLLSPILGRKKVKEHIFADYKHAVKSLGAWGGDFVMATFRDLRSAKDYFNSKGFSTMFTYDELIK